MGGVSDAMQTGSFNSLVKQLLKVHLTDHLADPIIFPLFHLDKVGAFQLSFLKNHALASKANAFISGYAVFIQHTATINKQGLRI